MSDTPKTDQAKIAAGFQAVPESFLVFARKLERENAALRADKERLVETIEHMDRIHTDIMDNGPRCTCGDGNEFCRRCGKSMKISRLANRALDAARKEAQP